MQLPRLTVRRLKRLTLTSIAAMAVLASLSRPGDEPLTVCGLGVIGLLTFATILPFLAYAFEIGVSAPRPGDPLRRPPRLPRLTTRRLLELVLVLAIGFAVALVLRHSSSRNLKRPHPQASTPHAAPKPR